MVLNIIKNICIGVSRVMWRMLYNNKINVCDSVFHPRFIYVIINSSTVDFMFLFNNLASDHEHEFENEHAARGQNM